MKENLEGIGYFTSEIFRLLTNQYKEHQFYFLFDRLYDQKFVFSSNVIPIILGPPARHPLLWKYWYDIKIPSALKKIKADVFISPDGFCSLTTKVPQCLIIHDLGFLHHPEAYKKTHLAFYKLYTPFFIKKAKQVVTVSQFSKNDIISQYQIPDEKINVVYSAAKEIFQPLNTQQKISIKKKYTEGKEFFVYTGAIQPRKNLVHLLKAFSLFKKRQQTNWKLILSGRLAWKNEEFLKLLKTYKYREDVIITGYIAESELALLTASAYAMIYPSFFEGFGVPVLEAMKSGVPVLTSVNSSMREIGDEAALYFDPLNVNDMADKLMLIYKDEDLRNSMIEKGKKRADQFSWEHTAALLWQCIEKTVRD
ncbi:MAG: glycosyltransferase family 4 protein [Chitinophagaceae bacterium]